MIESFVTIIIPCKNSLPGIKTTIENLADQSKIKGTRVIVLDLGSDDGSFLYVQQSAFELVKKSKIESLNIKDADNTRLYEEIITPYILWISPGFILDSKDFIFDSINKMVGKKNIFLHKQLEKNILKNFFPKYYLNKGKLFLSCIFCKKNILPYIKYKQESNSFNMIIDKFILKNNYKIIAGKISES